MRIVLWDVHQPSRNSASSFLLKTETTPCMHRANQIIPAQYNMLLLAFFAATEPFKRIYSTLYVDAAQALAQPLGHSARFCC